MDQRLNCKEPLESRNWIFDFHPGLSLKDFKVFEFFLNINFSTNYSFLAVFKTIWEANSKIQILEVFCNKVVSVPAKYEPCAAEIVGEVGSVMYFLKSTNTSFRFMFASLMIPTPNSANWTTRNLGYDIKSLRKIDI